MRFNPRARVGRDARCHPSISRSVLFQSTRPCGARRQFIREYNLPYCVSIHAPVWGATKHIHPLQLDVIVSIHAPVWGATQRTKDGGRSGKCFNPRARVGRDGDLENRFQTSDVSYTRRVGATSGIAGGRKKRLFQSTRRGGATASARHGITVSLGSIHAPCGRTQKHRA